MGTVKDNRGMGERSFDQVSATQILLLIIAPICIKKQRLCSVFSGTILALLNSRSRTLIMTAEFFIGLKKQGPSKTLQI
jgi:hypothetical protein